MWLKIRFCHSWFRRPSVLSRISIRTQVTCTNIAWLPQSIEICSVTTKQSSHLLEASIKTPYKILFCKQMGLYILHTKWGLFVKGHLAPLCMFIVTSKTNFMFFRTTPMDVYILTPVLSKSQHQCHWLIRCLCKHFTFEEWLKISSKTSLVMWHRAIKVNLAILIPNITENYT